ncbi:YfiR family protein [Candidatus Albibeggiatoa sp. nov. NOAA]|uniref:YfiR family protein n=1 Tax=Candidatus Albibeggiatoa sp. nov. NOAA TaxID=3162724 RepID=UPI0032F5A667|nr:YfiR family protein [Thiotrichaceae bacterium]
MTPYALFHLKPKAGDKLFALLSSFSNYKLIAIVVYFMLLFGLTYQVGQAKQPSEYQLKAAFLYNVARMVDWPKADRKKPLVVCLVGKDPFGAALNSIKKKKVKKRPLKFMMDVKISDISECNIVFITQDVQDSLTTNILPSIENQHILTVGDVPDFATQGGMVNLLKNGERIAIEINLKAVKASNIVISSRLLTLAKIVDE